MSNLKPWYKVVTPREDLREGKPLDASEFAVHLDQVRDGRAPEDYQNPERFFERTYITQNIMSLASEVLRRLNGIKMESSPIFNLSTQFGGGKSHTLTLLYHLANNGDKAKNWSGVNRLMEKAGVTKVPQANIAVFVGTEFDSITGRGGTDGAPVRKTPWGEIAYQLSGKEGLNLLAEHEKQMMAPAGDVIRQILPKNKPCLILIDELMNYVSRNRKSGLAAQLYNFMQNLSEVARGEDNVVLAVSIPASEMEMTGEDQADFNRLKKLMDRLGKAVFMSAESETSEIIRRRLFEWNLKAIASNGKVNISKDAMEICRVYGDWIVEHRQEVPGWFPVDNAREVFANTYPFHPMVLSVFERKWQGLPRFQQTRGVLRLLALWVSKAYQEGYKGAHKDLLISPGTAPLDDPLFRAPVFEQLGENRLESAITTDICGKAEAHSIRLDNEAVKEIKESRLHRKIATVIFFESNGGQVKEGEATVPEIRLAVAEPFLNSGNIEPALEALSSSCYYLSNEKNRFKFSIRPNLNKLLSDRRASIKPEKITERVKEEIKKVFEAGGGIDKIYFPEKSKEIQDRPALALIILSPEYSIEDKNLMSMIETMTREHGTSARTFKSALIWAVAEQESNLKEEARKVLAWQEIEDEAEELRLDESQKKQLSESLKKSLRDLKECVWRSYKNIILLGKNNTLRVVDLGLVHSSAAPNMTGLIINRLKQDGDIEDAIGANFLVRNWPPAFIEWSTKSVRDAFFASPQFPRLLHPENLKDTIARGVMNKNIGYVGKTPDGRYEPFYFDESLSVSDIEISEDMFIVTAETAIKKIEPPRLESLVIWPENVKLEFREKRSFTVKGFDQDNNSFDVDKVVWDATGGTIDESGLYEAGDVPGSFIVTAKCGDISQSLYINITKKADELENGEGDGNGDGEDDFPPPPAPAKKIMWQGTITPQKWMNFYSKVLTKHHANKSLKISVSFEFEPDGGVNTQNVEEIRVALRELGLKDNVNSI